ncbi:transposase [Paracoccus halophilus]|uniref:Transposase n=1 Tax=Paracoccus halophilus TaxID=376733 RepID=A0A099F077_9RHOB|nr:transposase [Paracoccus halophilus]
MNCMKRLGPRLMSREFDRQAAQVQIRAAVMNRFTALGIPFAVPAE